MNDVENKLRHRATGHDGLGDPLAQVAAEALILIDEEFNVAGLNQQARQLFRFPPTGKFETTPLARLIRVPHESLSSSPADWLLDPLEGEVQQPHRVSAFGRRADGSEFPASITVTSLDLAIPGVMPAATRMCFLALLRDMSLEQQVTVESLAPGHDGAAAAIEPALPETAMRRVGDDPDRSAARERTRALQLSANVVHARENERKHIARELHDELGQRLTALKMRLESLPIGSADPGSGHSVREMLEMVDETVAAVRHIASNLRPLMLDDLGLNSAIEWLARDVSRKMDIEITVGLDGEDPDIDDFANIAMYRVVQEALTNVARHAMATEAHIELHQGEDDLTLQIQDNGIGFPEDALQREESFGLMGIRERAMMLGGDFETENPLAGGARVTLRLPLGKASRRLARQRGTHEKRPA